VTVPSRPEQHVGRSAESSKSGGTFHSAEDPRRLAAYTEDRFVTIVPEVDMPGHASACVQLRSELNVGRNLVEFELTPGHKHHTAWLDPETARDI
jgi:N-acetyl-beta-hexosaminidase